jgi:hypothetical protein
MDSAEEKIKEQRNKVVGLLGVEGTPNIVEINKLEKNYTL